MDIRRIIVEAQTASRALALQLSNTEKDSPVREALEKEYKMLKTIQLNLLVYEMLVEARSKEGESHDL